MKESRLFRILYYLLGKGHATAPELAEELEVSVRTIYRDIDRLSSAGIPVYVTTGRNGGIQLLDNYVLEKALFSDTEKQSILATLQSLSVIGNTYEKEMLTKLSALFNIASENWFEVDFSRWGDPTKDNEKFKLLKTAVVGHRAVSIVYVNSCGEKIKRTIRPLCLLYKAKEWYVKAFCTTRQDFRIFKMNRIIELALLNETFTPVDYPGPSNVPAMPCNTLKLRFPQELAYRVYDEFEPDDITVDEATGTLIVTTRMPEDAWLIGYLLSFGANVEIIEPIQLRKILSDEAKKIYELNKP